MPETMRTVVMESCGGSLCFIPIRIRRALDGHRAAGIAILRCRGVVAGKLCSRFGAPGLAPQSPLKEFPADVIPACKSTSMVESLDAVQLQGLVFWVQFFGCIIFASCCWRSSKTVEVLSACAGPQTSERFPRGRWVDSSFEISHMSIQ